jgi:hypothetical protein
VLLKSTLVRDTIQTFRCLIHDPVKDFPSLIGSKFHEGDMGSGVGKPPFFDGTNYLYWKIRTGISSEYRV